MSQTVQTALERRYALLGLALIAPTVLVFCAVIVYPLMSAIYLSLFHDVVEAEGEISSMISGSKYFHRK